MSEKHPRTTSRLGSQSLLFTMLLLALLTALSGCGPEQTNVGQTNGNSVPVSLNISMPQESAAASTSENRFWATVQSWLPSLTSAWAAITTDLRTLTVEATGPGIPSPITSQPIPLSAPTRGQIITAEVEVPVGPDRVFIAHGFDAAGLEIFRGESSPITLTPGQAASVDVILIDITTGTVTGTVTNVGTGTPLPNATVAVTGTSIRTTTTSDGTFTLDRVPQGRQTLAISASGFTSTTRDVTITAGASVSAGTIALTPPRPTTTGTVTGTVTNALTGRPIPSASVRIVSTSLQVTTDTNGSFRIDDVPEGPRTVEASATGFITNSVTVNVVPRQTHTVGISLSPVILAPGQIRIILNWGRTPNDLDAHLLVPTTPTTEVCFSQRGTLTGSPFAQLDTDERFHSARDSRLGPETITIAAPSAEPPPRFAGIYRYFVRNFLLAERDLLTSSGASIQVVTGDSDREVARFTIPTTGTGRDWEVFTLDGSTGSITPIEGSNGRITTIPTTQCPPSP